MGNLLNGVHYEHLSMCVWSMPQRLRLLLLVEIYRTLGVRAFQQGRFEEAKHKFKKSWSLRVKWKMPIDYKTICMCRMLGDACLSMGDYEEAEEYYLHVLHYYQHDHSACSTMTSSFIVESYVQLFLAQYSVYRRKKANPSMKYQSSLTHEHAVECGPHSPSHDFGHPPLIDSSSHRNPSDILRVAESHLRYCITQFSSTYESNSIVRSDELIVVAPLLTLAELYVRTNRLSMAISVVQKCLGLMHLKLGTQHPETIYTKKLLHVLKERVKRDALINATVKIQSFWRMVAVRHGFYVPPIKVETSDEGKSTAPLAPQQKSGLKPSSTCLYSFYNSQWSLSFRAGASKAAQLQQPPMTEGRKITWLSSSSSPTDPVNAILQEVYSTPSDSMSSQPESEFHCRSSRASSISSPESLPLEFAA